MCPTGPRGKVKQLDGDCHLDGSRGQSTRVKLSAGKDEEINGEDMEINGEDLEIKCKEAKMIWPYTKWPNADGKYN